MKLRLELTAELELTYEQVTRLIEDNNFGIVEMETRDEVESWVKNNVELNCENLKNIQMMDSYFEITDLAEAIRERDYY